MILLLGGTGEALRLAKALTARGLPVTASLAGATARPAPYPCPTRTGGFGGAAGLADWLRDHDAKAMIDATHPYATQISANALAAARETGTPLIRVDRPPWTPAPGERWTEVATVEAAVAALPPGARALLTLGRGAIPALGRRDDIWTALRVVDPPDAPYPGRGQYLVARPPFDVEAEMETLSALRATHLVAKNAGGAAARAKLTAAAALGLDIIVVARPAEAETAALLPEEEIPDWAARMAAK